MTSPRAIVTRSRYGKAPVFVTESRCVPGVSSIAVSAKVAEGQQGRSFAVKIRLENTGGITLRSGMSCRAEIFAATREGVLAAPGDDVGETAPESLAALASGFEVALNRPLRRRHRSPSRRVRRPPPS